MKAFSVLLWSLAFFFSLAGSVKADTVFIVDFESSDSGYTQTGGFFESTNDYWTRTNGSDISTALSYLDNQGSYFFAGEDTDRGGKYGSVSVTTASFSVTNYTDLRVSLLLAAGGSGNEYEGNDYISLQYSFDGGTFTQLASFSGESYSSGSPLKQDTDLNNLGDGIALSNAFQKFTYAVPGYPGNNLQIRIEANMDSSGEEVAFDNIVIDGTSQVPLPSTVILLGSGLFGVVGLRKKLRK